MMKLERSKKDKKLEKILIVSILDYVLIELN